MGGGMGMPMSMGGMGIMPIGMGGMGMGGMGMPMVIPLGMGGGGAGGMADYMKTLSELLKQQGGGGGDRMDLDECSDFYQEPKFQARKKHKETLTFRTKNIYILFMQSCLNDVVPAQMVSKKLIFLYKKQSSFIFYSHSDRSARVRDDLLHP